MIVLNIEKYIPADMGDEEKHAHDFDCEARFCAFFPRLSGSLLHDSSLFFSPSQ